MSPPVSTSATVFPDTPANRAFVGQTLRALAEDSDVVVVNPGLKVDDHDDVLIPRDRGFTCSTP